MRIEDGIFGEYALIGASQSIDDPLPLHTETFKATKHDVDEQAFWQPGETLPAGKSVGDRKDEYKINDLTTVNTDGLPAEKGDDVYRYPAMAGKCVKIYTNGVNGTITIRPLGGKDDGADDVDIEIYAGTMMPLACKGITGLTGAQKILVMA